MKTAQQQPVIFGKGSRTITLENGYKVGRTGSGSGATYSYRQYHAPKPKSLNAAMLKAGEPADIAEEVLAAARKLATSAQTEQRRQQGR